MILVFSTQTAVRNGMEDPAFFSNLPGQSSVGRLESITYPLTSTVRTETSSPPGPTICGGVSSLPLVLKREKLHAPISRLLRLSGVPGGKTRANMYRWCKRGSGVAVWSWMVMQNEAFVVRICRWFYAALSNMNHGLYVMCSYMYAVRFGRRHAPLPAQSSNARSLHDLANKKSCTSHCLRQWKNLDCPRSDLKVSKRGGGLCSSI